MIAASQFPELPTKGDLVVGYRGKAVVTQVTSTTVTQSLYTITIATENGKRISIGSLQKIYILKGGARRPVHASTIQPWDIMFMVVDGTLCRSRVIAVAHHTRDESMLVVKTKTGNIVVGGFLCRA